MDNVKYKEYTPEESRIYDQAMARIRKAVEGGASFPDACALAGVDDPDLRAFIVDDALKVLIGEMHFGKARPLEQVAEVLKVPLRMLHRAVAEMLEDAGIAAAAAYRNSAGGPVGNA